MRRRDGLPRGNYSDRHAPALPPPFATDGLAQAMHYPQVEPPIVAVAHVARAAWAAVLARHEAKEEQSWQWIRQTRHIQSSRCSQPGRRGPSSRWAWTSRWARCSAPNTWSATVQSSMIAQLTTAARLSTSSRSNPCNQLTIT